MTLRLTDEQDAALTALAAAQGISKNEAAARAISESATRLGTESEVRRIVRDILVEDGPLLDRLAQ
ncbi:MAG: CopG family transcriptional regulator [Aeromicrobium sp.]|uniref:CopG family transcriptional regulator n=1 Tax=Aeromicrobium sp. TaxID=1871063 RepID=UPI00261907FA|nr:CopG family transcriptional regulator [Aeromicrobium sp.]MDF1705714.1 CopG family transcriptional regulator [Aeromicrobium sp.]